MSARERNLLPADVLAILRCTDCSCPLLERDDGYCCTSCGKNYPLLNGVLRFVDPRNYADSFGYQWKKFDRTQLLPESAEWDLRNKTGLGPDDFKGKLVLDVGCGMGRFADVATRWGARVVGIDLSAAAEVAARNLSDRRFVALQADVLSLPFAPESFDCIYSIGVLHHTPNCEKAFKSLPQYLKPGGSLGVWLYSGYNKWYRFSDFYRKVTHRLSTRSLHRFFRVAVPVLYRTDRMLRHIPGLGRPLAGVVHHVFPISLNHNSELRLLDTLDWYSPKYQSKHTYEQVFRWFESCGLDSLTVADYSIGVKGRKPLVPARKEPPQSPTQSDSSGCVAKRGPMLVSARATESPSYSAIAPKPAAESAHLAIEG